jgi:hypothetical protein
MKRIIFCFLFASTSFSLVSQNNSGSGISFIDSLKTRLELNQNDTLKAELLMMIAQSYQFNYPDSAIYYGERALEQAKRFKNIAVMVGTLGFIGTSLRLKGNLPKALEMGFNAIELGRNLPVHITSGIAGIGPLFRTIVNAGRQRYTRVDLGGETRSRQTAGCALQRSLSKYREPVERQAAAQLAWLRRDALLRR